jgi:hypothetical protein
MRSLRWRTGSAGSTAIHFWTSGGQRSRPSKEENRPMTRAFSRSTVAALLFGTALAVPFAPTALAQPCPDPRGASYCTNNGLVDMTNPTAGNVTVSNPTGGLVHTQNPTPGQVTFSPPPSSPRQTTPVQPQAPQKTTSAPAPSGAAATGSVTVDPPAALAGATVTVSVSGLPANAGFVVNLAQLKSTAGLMWGAKNMQTADGAPLQTDRNGNFSGTFTVPTVPDFIAPQGSVCAAILGKASYCTPFALQSAGLPPVNTATASSIVGHYQCSAMLLVGTGGGWCSGSEPLLVLNGDGTYSWADEQGTYAYDDGSSQISFSGGLGDGNILNRKLIVESSVDGMTVRYTYIRMDY